VSHAIGDVKAIGDRCMWLEKGRIKQLGDTEDVVGSYLAAMTVKDSAYLEHKLTPEHHMRAAPLQGPPEIVERIPNVDHRHGDGRAEIIGIAVYDEYGRELPLLQPSSRIVVRISARAKEDLNMPNVGFMLRNHLGLDFAGTNSSREGYELPPMQAGEFCTVDFHLEIPELYPAAFSFSPAIANGSLHSYSMCDWIDNAITLQMGHGDAQIYGYLHLPCKIEVNARLERSGPEANIA
jgi:hypothetical protein